MFEPGDIICSYRRKAEGPFKCFLAKIVLFFTTEWWYGEKTSSAYHNELVYDKIGDIWYSITMEPPYCRTRKMSLKRIIVFRLNHKPDGFELEFRSYINRKLGQKYDYFKLTMCFLDWSFHTTWFTNRIRNFNRDICSEFVSRFYEEYGIPCSKLPPDSTKPDDIYDFCLASKQFRIIYEDRTRC